MDFHVYGTSFGHKRGEFAPRLRFDFYFFGYFHTDYLYEKDGTLIPGQAGDLLIVPPGEIVYHGARTNAQSGFVNDWMHVGGKELCALFEKFPLPLLTPIRTDAKYLAGAITRIHREQSFRQEGYEEKCDLIMTELLIDLYRSYRQSIATRAETRLEQVRGRMMQNYMQGWTIEEMARLAGYSTSRFASVYKQAYGIAPIEDLIRERIENAKRLLLYSHLRISEIADTVGFSSLYYFSRAFKKLVGISPSEYRENANEHKIGIQDSVMEENK